MSRLLSLFLFANDDWNLGGWLGPLDEVVDVGAGVGTRVEEIQGLLDRTRGLNVGSK